MTEQISASSTQAGTSLITASRGLVDWLASRNVSLAVSTYQTGKLFLIGRNKSGQFSLFERTFERAMGLARNDQTIYMATLHQCSEVVPIHNHSQNKAAVIVDQNLAACRWGLYASDSDPQS